VVAYALSKPLSNRRVNFRIADDSGSKSGVLSDVFVLRSAQFLGESDEKFFRPADIAEPIRGFVLDYFAYELPAALVEPFKPSRRCRPRRT